MFGCGYKISSQPVAKPPPVANRVDGIPGYKAYCADKIGPYSALVSNAIFGQGQNNVKSHNQYQKHTPSSLEGLINIRVNAQLKKFEENIDKRRARLRELINQEQTEQVREVVDMAQRGNEFSLRDAKIRTQQLRYKRESERLEIVKEKKLQQYLEKCHEFRPILENRRLIETKEAQKLQIIEKENKEKSEKEINHMWYEMLMKELKTRTDREDQNNLAIRKRNLEDRNTWDIQCQNREIEKLDKRRETREEGIQLDSLKEEIRRDEIMKLDENRRKRDICYRDSMNQIREKQEILAKKAQEEKLCQNAYNKLQQEEIEKERGFQQKEKLRQETDLYYDYILRLDQDRKDEEKQIDILIEQEFKNIQQKQDEARQRYQKAREALQKAVIEGRNVQVEYKKEEAEQQLKIKQAENQILQMANDQNERLKAELSREQILAAQKYSEDLKQQIESRKLIMVREKNEIERQLQQGRMEEEEYKRNLIKILNSDVKVSEVHPFRQVLSKDRIPCVKNLYY